VTKPLHENSVSPVVYWRNGVFVFTGLSLMQQRMGSLAGGQEVTAEANSIYKQLSVKNKGNYKEGSAA
jgi:hypothetical protein